MPNLILLNHWWKGREQIKEDKNIKEFEEKEYKYVHDVLKNTELKPNNVFTLRGPRQVWKTTVIKLKIRDLLFNEKINENAIFFWNCDELTDFKELSSIIREYLEFSKIRDVKEKYIFLDEISGVKEWQKSIKSLIDSGELEDCCLVLTGSNTLDIKYGIERLPGRTGKLGKDVLLLPLKFSEYISLIKPEIFNKVGRTNNLSIKEIMNKVTGIEQFDSELKLLFNQYIITGGFPLVINEFFSNKKIPDYIYELYYRWVIGDIVKWGKQEKIATQILSAAIIKQSSAVSWNSFAKESEIKSHKTVSSYIEDFENMFVFLILYFLELNKKIPDYNKNKKIYFLDPFIYHVFNKKMHLKENEISPSLIESTAISNLARLTYEELSPNIYYWKNKREVDAVLKIKNELFPFEVKYQNKISREDYDGLHHFNNGVLITKDKLERHEKYPAIPIHLFLAVI